MTFSHLPFHTSSPNCCVMSCNRHHKNKADKQQKVCLKGHMKKNGQRWQPLNHLFISQGTVRQIRDANQPISTQLPGWQSLLRQIVATAPVKAMFHLHLLHVKGRVCEAILETALSSSRYHLGSACSFQGQRNCHKICERLTLSEAHRRHADPSL